MFIPCPTSIPEARVCDFTKHLHFFRTIFQQNPNAQCAYWRLLTHDTDYMCRSKPRICRALLPSFYNKRSFACWYHSITKDGSDMNRPLHFIILTGLLVSIAICAVLSENQMAELLEQPSELGPSILELYLAPFGNKDVGKLNWAVHHVCRNTNPEFFTYSRVWNKRTPLNKRSP